MTTPPVSRGAVEYSAPVQNFAMKPGETWKKAAGKKPCKNCPHWFKPREKGGSEQLFCTNECRKEFHRNGAAFGKLREQLPKMIAKEVERQAPQIIAQLRDVLRETIADALRHDYDFIERREIGVEGLRLLARAVERARIKTAAVTANQVARAI
jgi:hypothetical protein